MNKTLKATLQALLEVVASDDGDMLDSFQASPSTESLKSTSSDPGTRQAGRRRGQQQETETFYITVGLGGQGRGMQGWVQLWRQFLNSELFLGLPEAPGISEWTEHPCQASGQAREAAGGLATRWALVQALPLSPTPGLGTAPAALCSAWTPI